MELSGEECQASVQALLRIVECPVCYMVPRDSNLAQCLKGHVVCSVCRPQLKNECPLCRQKFTGQEPTVVKQILNVLPKFCKNPGCSYMLKPGDDHDFICHFLTVTCKLCPSVLSIVDSLSHVKRAHGTVLSESNVALVPLCVNKCKLNGTVPTFTMDQLFWTTYFHDKQGLLITVNMWLTSEQLYEPAVSATVELSDESGNLFAFTKMLSYEGDLKRILTFKFTVPESIILSFSENPGCKIKVITNNNNNYLLSTPSSFQNKTCAAGKASITT